MARPKDPELVALAAKHEVTYKHARKLRTGQHKAAQGFGRPRRVTEGRLKEALSPFFGPGFAEMKPTDRRLIEVGFSMSANTVRRHLADLREEYAGELHSP